MKKLFMYALLLVTGFALYSCDERFDNPVAEQQDPSNPNATWSYEVKIEFDAVNVGFYDVAEQVTRYYENPDIVYVYNTSYQPLGTLSRVEQDGDDIFKGTLKGAIGDSLIISTLENFDFYSKQDGTGESILKHSILQVAKLPIVVANATTGKIGTQKAIMKNQTKVIQFNAKHEGHFFDGDVRSFTITSENFSKYMINTEDKSFTVNLADRIDFNDWFTLALVNDAEDPNDAVYRFDIKNDAYTASAYLDKDEDYFDNINWNDLSNSSYTYLDFKYLKDGIDLTKYFDFIKKQYKEEYDKELPETWQGTLPIYSKDPKFVIEQTGKEALPFLVIIYNAHDITLKDINITCMATYSDDYGYLPVITLEGDNIIGSKDNTTTFGFYSATETTFKGSGSLTIDADVLGIIANGYYPVLDAEGNSQLKPAGIIIEDDVKIVSKNMIAISGLELNGVKIESFLKLNGGSLDVSAPEGSFPVYLISRNGATSKMTIGTGAKYFKAKTGLTDDVAIYVYDEKNVKEAALDILVEDATKFNDETKDGVRTITPKK